ncbi:MAG: hypothetical protein VX498_15900 [Myxococcota bacterium]|nr:hypothetical protein [Myxococcota bacterium]
MSHDEAGFSLTVPSDWQVNSTGRGLSLVRKTPYGGGFPLVKIRRITSAEAEVLAVKGNRIRRSQGGEITYRYQRWSNARGTGYRLEALVRSDRGLLFADASVWDSSTQINRKFFETEFWPVINSLKEWP